MLSMAQTTFNFNKYPQSCWILMKIIETSPIIFNNIHFQVCSLFFNCLNQIEKAGMLQRGNKVVIIGGSKTMQGSKEALPFGSLMTF
jgi:hypothetical protein